MEQIGCIFCGDTTGDIVIRENGFEGKFCRDCQLIYVSPRPTLDEIEKLYSHDEAHVPAAVHFYGAVEQRLHARHTLALLERHRGSGKRGLLLEVGSGGGFFLDEARRGGYEVRAIEMSEILSDFINDTLAIPCDRQALSRASFGNTIFDVFYHRDVISHFSDPIRDFETTRDKLAPDGFMIFETGNFAELDQERLQQIPTYQYPDHLFFFGERSIGRLLERTGFELLHVYRYSLSPKARLVKAVDTLKQVLKPQRADDHAASAPEHRVPSRLEGFETLSDPRRWLSLANQLLSFSLRYKLGAVRHRHGTNQTLIAVARKR